MCCTWGVAVCIEEVLASSEHPIWPEAAGSIFVQVARSVIGSVKVAFLLHLQTVVSENNKQIIINP